MLIEKFENKKNTAGKEFVILYCANIISQII